MSDISEEGGEWQGGSSLGGSLYRMLMAKAIQPGDTPSYQLCKTIYVDHPLGGKMVDSPIKIAQCQKRELGVGNSPDDIIQAFEKEWEAIGANGHVANIGSLARIYGQSSIVLGCKGTKSAEPLDMTKIWNKEIFFNVLDPLNTAGSLVLNQDPNSPDFLKPATVVVAGQTYHRSRSMVLFNEKPIYIEYTNSAFGFSGRSVYQRALFPLKSFINTMISDDWIAVKNGLIVAKQKQPGALTNKIMQMVGAIKRVMLKGAASNNVISIDITEDVSTLDMQGVDTSGAFARGNILKNIATANDMPAFFLENETLAEGFGEGTEDAKNIARYIETIREWLQSIYAWFDNIVMHRAWNPEFFALMQAKYPERFGKRKYAEVFSEWRNDFVATWPSILIEPESELIKVDQTRLEAAISLLQTLLPVLDPENKVRTVNWVIESLGMNKLLFDNELILDSDALLAFLVEEKDRQAANDEAAAEKPTDKLAQRVGSFRG